jgi:hypothetical protein
MNNKKHGRCRGYELPTKPPKIVRDGRNFCGHPDCLDPATGDLRPEAEGWPDTMAIYRHFQVMTFRKSCAKSLCKCLPIHAAKKFFLSAILLKLVKWGGGTLLLPFLQKNICNLVSNC